MAMATRTTSTRTAPATLATEARMLEAWRALSEAEQTPGVPVSLLDRLYDGYVLALYAHVAAVRKQMAWEDGNR